MDLREKCAQLVFADYRFDRPDPARARRLAALGVGGFCFFYGDRAGVVPLGNELQRAARTPLLFASDYEHGVGHQVSGATVFPPSMAVAASRSDELSRLKGLTTAREARALGVPWVLAPVLDLNKNPKNPIINTRSFGEDPALAARLALAFVQGLREGGALSCGKHFPGHGDVTIDSHLELPALDRPDPDELRVYRELAGQLDSVMTAHLLVRALDPDRPASLSRNATEGLLRNEIQFGKVVTTDALMMGGVTKVIGEDDALVLAVNAGADVLLYPLDPERAVATIERAVLDGRVERRRIDESVARILELKERAKIERAVPEEPSRAIVASAESRAAAQRIADAAVTLVRGDARVGERAAFLRVADASARGDLSVFERELATRVKLDDDARTCVVAVFFKQKAFTGKSGLDEHLTKRIDEAARRHARLVVVSFGSPYVVAQLPGNAEYVCAWGEDEFSQRAAARALAGELPFEGRLPVALPGVS